MTDEKAMDYNWIKEHFPEVKTVKGKTWIELDYATYEIIRLGIHHKKFMGNLMWRLEND